MKKEKLQTAFYVTISIIDLFLLSAALVLQYLSDKKMGVMRYLVFLRYEFEKGWFNPNLIKLYETILEAGFILCLFIIIFSIFIRKNREVLRTAVLALTAIAIGYFLLTSQTLSSLKAYHLIVIAFFVIILFQFIILIYHLLRKRT